ncbi:MAG: carboxypeptidase regulatory-like domain-containing protein [Blastocatellia bacterium]
MRKGNTLFFTLAALSVIWIFSIPALGQVTASLTGVVTNPQGDVIKGAKVTASNKATGFKQETVTNSDGFYRLDLLPVGAYGVTAEFSGFKQSVNNAVNLSVNDVLRADFKLELGQISEVVTVSESPTIVNTETSTLGKVVDNRTLTDLPVLSAAAGGRNPLQLAPLQSGVVVAGQVGPFAVNGQRAQANNFMLDGGDSNDLAINVPDAVQGFSPDALQEFRILTNTYSAEYGRNSGSVVNAISKSGGNQFHGNVFEFFRNRVLNATPFFNNSPATFNGLRNPKFNLNEFGGTLGGPVIKEKTFFHFSYQGFRRRQGVAQSAVVFSDAERAAINQFGTPQAKALLAQVPRANSGTNTLLSTENNRLDRNQYIGRVDHSFSSNNRLSVLFFTEKQDFTDPFAFGGSTIPGFGTKGDLRFTNVVIGHTSVLSSNLVNEARVSFHRRGTFSVIPVNNTPPSNFGINGINPDDSAAPGPPSVQIAGRTQFGNTIQGPQGRFDNTLQYSDNLSHRLGSKHFLKYGADVRTYAQNQVFDFINNGVYVFQGGVSGAFGLPAIPGITSAAVTDFANGVATVYAQNSDGRKGYRTRSFNFYGQDDFKIKPSFTMNLGLRYELNTNLYDIRDEVAGFRPGQQSTVFPTAPVGLIFPEDTGISRSTYPNDYNNFAPRVGFAWDVLGNGKLSMRGGSGMYYDIVISETTLQFLTSAPYAIQPNIIFTTINNPFSGSLVNPRPQPFPHTPAKAGDPFNFAGVAPVALTVNDANFRTPYAYQYNMQVQYEFLRGYTLEVGYVGTSGVKLLTRRQVNPALVTPTATTQNTSARRVFNQNNPQNAAFGGSVFGGITNQETSANSNYSSLQITVSKRFSQGFQFQGAYTYGHCIDNASGLRSNVRFNDTGADRGNCESDVRQRYVVSYIWELPFGKGLKGVAGKLLSGWQVAGVTQFQTGLPFNITEPEDRSLSGAGGDRPDFVGGVVQFFDPRNVDASLGGLNRYFNGTGGGTATAATNPFFRRVGSGLTAVAGAGRFGTLGRNVFFGPGINNWDFSLLKRTKVTETQEIEVRGEFFNLANHAQFNNPNASVGSPNFGAITATRDPRIIQLALKYKF